jgi:cbb3-type cytochrome oxidase subunit 3
MELLVILVFVALVAYAFGVGKQERDRAKRQIAEYDSARREGREPRKVP